MYNLEIKEVVIVHCNIISNDSQNYIRDLYVYIFVPNKSFGQLWDILPKNFIFKNF